jgi:DUF4097 and DUF4098 domain-containing protein YvlB
MGSREIQIGLIAVATAAAFAGETQLRREGAFWVEVEKGSEQVAAHGKIQISTIGGVTIKGSPGTQLAYTIVKRVKAGSEAQARRLLSAYSLRLSRQGDLTYLVVQGGSEMAALEVMAPRSSSLVVVKTAGGTVDAMNFAGEMKAETGGGRINIDQVAGDVSAKTAGGDVTFGKIGGDVRCVSGGGTIRADSIHGEAVFATAGGDIQVQQVDGPVHCSTNGGAIHVAQAGNIVIADTAGGPIDVGYAKGMVTAKNSGGPIQVGSASGARCESANGAIHLTSVGGSLKASTAMGSIIARFQTQPVEDSFLSTGAGDITVWIPSNLKITLRAQNASYGGPRRIVSDFPDFMVKLAGAATVAEGALNGGGPLVRIAGTGGTIYIRREEK